MLRLIALLLIPTLWGVGFLATRWGLMGAGPLWLTEWRFLLAALLAAPFFPWRRFRDWQAAFIAAGLLFAGMALQTVGLSHTTVAKNAFITALYAMFIPIIGALFLRHRILAAEWMALVVALVGVGFMCDLNLGGLNVGDLYTLACAGAFSLHILWLDRCARSSTDLLGFGLAQVMAVAVIGLPFAWLLEGAPHLGGMTLLPVLGIAYLTVGSTLLSFVLQPWVQRAYPAHVAGVVFLLESPIAAL
ncbi:MAG TPA: DMT family transporter, partial [Stenomitos sp.]